MSSENLLRAAYYIYSNGYNNPVAFGDDIWFGDEDGGDFGDVEQCVFEFDIYPYTIDPTYPATFDFTGNPYAGTKYLRRWTAAWPANLNELQNPSSFTSTNQVIWTDSGAASSVSLDTTAIIADMVSASLSTIRFGIPEDAEAYASGQIDYDGVSQPTLNYRWIRDDFEGYAENRLVSTIAGWTTNSANVKVATATGSKRAGVFVTTASGYMERTMDATGTLSYDYSTASGGGQVQVRVGGTLIKSHISNLTGSDSVTVAAGQVVQFNFTSGTGGFAWIDNLSLAVSAESKVLNVTLDDITLTSTSPTVRLGTSNITLDAITLTSAANTDASNDAVLNLDPITLTATGSWGINGNLQQTITIGLESNGKVDIRGSFNSDPIIISLFSGDQLAEGILNVTLDDILVSGEIPQGGRPVRGTFSSELITIFLDPPAVAKPKLFGATSELTSSEIVITLYARSAADPPVAADSPFLDPPVQIILGDKNATFR